MLKLDMHIHSYFSFDSLSRPEKIAEAAIKAGFDGVSITDHNVFRIKWDELQEKFPGLLIIPGTEIGTETGDILCYFINTEISSRKAAEVINETHRQGGLAVLAHPYHRRANDYPENILKMLDGIESCNSHNLHNRSSAERIAKEHGKACFGGSDAHFVSEIGNGWTSLDLEKPNLFDREKIKDALLKTSSPSCNKGPSWSFYASQAIKYAKRFKLLT